MDAALSAAIGATAIALLNELRARSNARRARTDREERERFLVGRPGDDERRAGSPDRRSQRRTRRWGESRPRRPPGA